MVQNIQPETYGIKTMYAIFNMAEKAHFTHNSELSMESEDLSTNFPANISLLAIYF